MVCVCGVAFSCVVRSSASDEDGSVNERCVCVRRVFVAWPVHANDGVECGGRRSESNGQLGRLCNREFVCCVVALWGLSGRTAQHGGSRLF